MEYCDVTIKTRTNLHVYRNISVHTKPLNGVSIRKNVSFGSFYNTEAGKCTTLMNFHIFRSHFHFTFGTRTAHQEKVKPIDERIRTSKLSDLMYAHIIKYCLVYFCVAFSRVLRIVTQNTPALRCRASRR